MMYKVYAQNVVKAKRIIEATKNDLDKAIQEIIDEAIENSLIDLFNDNDELDNEKYSDAYEKCETYFTKNGFISPGDYEIVNVNSRDDISIPNICHSDASIIF